MFLDNFSVNNFTLPDTEDNTSEQLNSGGIADTPLLRTLLAINQQSHEQSFWEMIESFILIAKASLTASKALCNDY